MKRKKNASEKNDDDERRRSGYWGLVKMFHNTNKVSVAHAILKTSISNSIIE